MFVWQTRERKQRVLSPSIIMIFFYSCLYRFISLQEIWAPKCQKSVCFQVSYQARKSVFTEVFTLKCFLATQKQILFFIMLFHLPFFYNFSIIILIELLLLYLFIKSIISCITCSSTFCFTEYSAPPFFISPFINK